jgi:hypothetical protein
MLSREVTRGTAVAELRRKNGEPAVITTVGAEVKDWRFFDRCKRT